MEPTAAAYFGDLVSSYDALICRAVPRYAEMTARLVDYLPERATRVLELGCGTGNLSLALAARYPEAELVCIDAAPEMIAATRGRIRALDPAVERRSSFVCARFEELELEPASFDVATSCISLHHVVDKGALYAALHAALAPGGTFRFADQLAGATRTNHVLNWERWLAFCRRPGHCDEAEVQSLLEHADVHDHYVPLAQHFTMLERAGFAPIDCVWRNWMWGIVTADRR